MKSLNGSDLVGFVKQRQMQQVRSLRQSQKIIPKLAIIRTNPSQIVDTYMQLKQDYGQDISVDVDIYNIKQADALSQIKELNADPTVHGIIVQLPLPDITQTTEILNSVSPQKDVDGLNEQTVFDASTPMAISWLLSGYNVDLRNKNILIIGQGRLVGAPLAKLWQDSNLQVTTADKNTPDIATLAKAADIIVTATGQPKLLTSDMLKTGCIIVDAGVATDTNGLTGDVDPGARQRDDIAITPEKGGVGPLTICALFDNLIRAANL